MDMARCKAGQAQAARETGQALLLVQLAASMSAPAGQVARATVPRVAAGRYASAGILARPRRHA